jgi:hypothetical protein
MNLDSFTWDKIPVSSPDISHEVYWCLYYCYNNKKDNIIDIYYYDNHYHIFFPNLITNVFYKLYVIMYSALYEDFNSLAEAKERVNQFLIRVCKLKVFL